MKEDKLALVKAVDSGDTDLSTPSSICFGFFGTDFMYVKFIMYCCIYRNDCHSVHSSDSLKMEALVLYLQVNYCKSTLGNKTARCLEIFTIRMIGAWKARCFPLMKPIGCRSVMKLGNIVTVS